jgi:hypothetical protein
MSRLNSLAKWMDKNAEKAPEDKVLETQQMMTHSLKQSTWESYKTPLSYFEAMFGKITHKSTPCLEQLMDFAKALVQPTEEGTVLKSDTILKYISAVKTYTEIHCFTFFSSNDNKILTRLVEGATAARDEQLQIDTKVVKRATPMKHEALLCLSKMKLSPLSKVDQIRSSAVLACVAVLRFDQIPKIRVEDIKFLISEKATTVEISLFKTKTEPFETRVSKCEQFYCDKIFCVTHYLQKICEKRDGKEFLFPDIKKRSFQKQFKDFMLREWPGKYIEWEIDSITCHSFRHTGATLLCESGVSQAEIKSAGHWRSKAWEGYAETAIKSKTMSHADLILKQ